MNTRTARIAARALLGAATFTVCSLTGAEPAPATAAEFHSYAVAADQPLASAAGAEILKAGGNAVDAAVATSFALSVVRPFSCGIGGGGFMVIAVPGESGKIVKTIAIDYRETCPAATGPDYFEKISPPDPDASRHDGKAVAIPGTIVGLLYALEKYGTMKREAVLAPAIRIARQGYVVDEFHVKAAADLVPKFAAHPEWKVKYAFVWKRLLASGEIKLGDTIKVPEQAAALELIARDGAAAYTDGALGDAIIEADRAAGGSLEKADLKSFKPRELEPICVGFLGRSVITMPPPSSGGVALGQIFGLMERRGIEKVVREERWAEYAQDLAESFKHAFADRAEWMADPAFVDVPVTRLLSPEYLDTRAAAISVTTTYGPEHYGTREQIPKDGGTSHLSVVDSRGGAAACTETINLVGGSLVCAGPYAFLLNDQMDDLTTLRGEANAFGLRQSDKNLPAPGKRPLSSMTPTIVLDKDGRVEAVAGASGGPRIITATAQALLNVLARHTTAAEAVSRARLHHQWMPNVLEIEDGYADRWEGLEIPMWLRKVHHQVVTAKDGAAVQLIVRTPSADGAASRWSAACDPRKGGRPAGE